MEYEQVARICHEANRSYCETIGDFSQKTWREAEDWQRNSAIKGVAFRVKSLEKGVTPPASAQHEAWLEEKRIEGWSFGPVKDTQRKEHPCFVPYDELPVEQRIKDYIFCAIVDAFFKAEHQEKKAA
jgi:hypothetical protein